MRGLAIMETASLWPAILVQSCPIWCWIKIGMRPYPKAFQHIPMQFPLGRFRRYMLAPIYALAQSVDL